MNRAIQTAKIISEGRDVEFITDERIRERKLELWKEMTLQKNVKRESGIII